MYRITLLFIFCLFLFFSMASAQTFFEPLPDVPISYLVTIEKNGTAKLDTPKAEESKSVTPNQLKDFFTALAAKINSRESTRGKDLVTFRPDPSVKVETVIAFIQSVRIPYTSKLRIEAGEGLFVLLPMKPAPGPIRPARPNPLYLLVSADKDGKLRLNGEDEGTLSDTTKLTDHLKRVFNDREVNGVFMERTNIIESTIFLKVPLSTTWGDAVKAIRAIRDGGGDPIGLQIEDLEK
jgi:biopolymer transport protein ExbD